MFFTFFVQTNDLWVIVIHLFLRLHWSDIFFLSKEGYVEEFERVTLRGPTKGIRFKMECRCQKKKKKSILFFIILYKYYDSLIALFQFRIFSSFVLNLQFPFYFFFSFQLASDGFYYRRHRWTRSWRTHRAEGERPSTCFETLWIRVRREPS